MQPINLTSENETIALGKQLALQCLDYLSTHNNGIIIYLIGDLGAGKTTFSRGFLHQMGHKGNVKSPTYTLVEPYHFENCSVYHFDLYRLSDPEELEFMGIREYFSARSICLIEWPEQGTSFLPIADIEIKLTYHSSERMATLFANTENGKSILQGQLK